MSDTSTRPTPRSSTSTRSAQPGPDPDRSTPGSTAPPPAPALPGDHHDGIVVIALLAGAELTWAQTSQILAWHRITAVLPMAAFPVTRHGLPGLVSRWSESGLLAPVRRHGVVTHATGGRLARLDLHHVTSLARDSATARWWHWQQHVAATTGPAQPWEQFQADHRTGKTSLVEAARRFHAQPRVLAMLAHNSYPFAAHHLDVGELAAFQAGLTVYVALHWQRPLTGDALITPWGQLLRPASGTVADRLHYLTTATQIVHHLTPTDHLIAVRAALPRTTPTTP